jgi:hypothetical protein
MLSFLKKIFCAAEPAQTPAPYKVEAPAPVAESTPAPKKPAAKKPAAKAKTPRKPRASKA